MNNKRIVLIIALAVAGATAAGFWFLWQNKQKVIPGSRAKVPVEETLGGALFQSVEEQQNPFKQTPEIAPLPAGTNPFKDAYRNPFAQ